ncbi:single-stranded DNA-binding protein [Paenibacillus alvei]|uniref:single-stranded DNA-binding protein n=1 Tax=Paenibacillus alvei TaxID=44250 RepID=UPI000289B6EB|nr:single-stranded DNA-binding protein [Paenibacillus alvei]EJW14839.1 single-stranded DNA-binding protein Ssb [Paenibacillus alvei DSM 29]MCY9543705.1 single-stranded DNA-binding protein [Paenibacillus alvei]MCY9708543.1 single-stranded DNA-binding protein [Paenibacillus alvei]MEC0083244.1 single-stranded DNA-binding protein [Paenibacillus alvei]
MINNVTLIGRAVREPELKYTGNGTAVATFTLACDRPFTGSDGKKETDFIPVVLWRASAEFAANNVKKGKLQAVTGRIQVRNYENTEGKKVFVTEVVADNIRVIEWGDVMNNAHAGDPFGDDGKPIEISDDDMPF